MNKIVVALLGVFILGSCGSEPQNKKITYQNLVILSDMSSRIDNKPNKDMEEIKKLISYFKNECVKPGEKIGDRSSILYTSFSDKMIASIDIDQIEGVAAKQQFVNSTGDYKSKGLKQQLVDFENKVNESYATIRNQGLDLISILIEKNQNDGIIKKDTILTDGVDTTQINYDNHIYIFTDGYLEYFNRKGNSQFYFGSSEIQKVRDYCKANKTDIKNALEKNKSLRLQPLKAANNKFINLHIYETHERDKDDKMLSYKNEQGLRDNEILEAVWRKWALESGFKSLEWKKY
ncbi:hypothetical protein L1S34_04315 [Flavobacterium sp. K77]|uniref:hypothetical protein n=1 Tax=Flavobacterium sp. K77 TaxID=2910676 RepID=UPI001F23C1A0|nr:hypothetical protein [Flavobacterium sp. K77]MCF6140502.1 hypothetical protein [Flavobacterium sp. K77]